MAEIPIDRQHDEFVGDAELGEQRIDDSDLDAVAAAFVAQAGRVDVIAARRYDHGDGRETLDDPRPGAWAPEALQQLLKHQAGRVDRLAAPERFPQALQQAAGIRAA